MKIKILNLNGTVTKDCVKTIHNIKEFLIALKNSPGKPGKPLRIIEDVETLKYLMAKFAFSGTPRKFALDDEYNNLKELRKMPELKMAHLVWGNSTENYTLVCTELIKPFENNISTFRDLVLSGNDLLMRSCLFQILFTLLQLQTHYKNFRHNDLKADNILVCKKLEDVTFAITTFHSLSGNIRRAWKTSQIESKIIDFEMAQCENNVLKSKNINNCGNEQKKFGLSKVYCPAFDVHLIIYDALLHSKNFPMQQQYLREFAYNFISEKYFDSSNLTVHCRLQINDQDKFNNFSVFDMLIHPYFHHLRVNFENKADIEIKIPLHINKNENLY